MEEESTGGGGGGGGSNSSTSEGERLLGISLKLLHSRDLTGAREFALLSQENDPLLDGSDQILAITDVLLASDKRLPNSLLHFDWYSILQSDPGSDPDFIKRNYRRLALLLHPDKNKSPFADSAFKLVSDAWSVLSDPTKRAAFDREFGLSGSVFSRVDLGQSHAPPLRPHAPGQDKDKLPVRRSSRAAAPDVMHDSSTNFWTACPYCYVLFEYPKVYEECCLRCQNCERAFHATPLACLPPRVPGKEAYYCCWGFFPLGFSLKGKDDDHVNVGNVNSGWMPGVGVGTFAAPPPQSNMNASVGVSEGSASAGLINNNNKNTSNVGTRASGYTNTSQGMGVPGAKKRGRPRKNPVPG